MPARSLTMTWLAIGVIASLSWFVVAVRLMRTWGLREAAPALALLIAVAVAITLWRWARADRDAGALAELRCPACAGALVERHEHVRPGGVTAGRQRWSCESCGYEHVESLTCSRCAA